MEQLDAKKQISLHRPLYCKELLDLRQLRRCRHGRRAVPSRVACFTGSSAATAMPKEVIASVALDYHAANWTPEEIYDHWAATWTGRRCDPPRVKLWRQSEEQALCDDEDTIGARIRTARLKLGLTQTQVMQQTGINLSRIEMSSSCTTETLVRLAAVLKTTPCAGGVV